MLFASIYILTRQCVQVHSLLTNLNTTAMVAPKHVVPSNVTKIYVSVDLILMVVCSLRIKGILSAMKCQCDKRKPLSSKRFQNLSNLLSDTAAQRNVPTTLTQYSWCLREVFHLVHDRSHCISVRLVLWFDPISPFLVALLFYHCASQTEYGCSNHFSSKPIVLCKLHRILSHFRLLSTHHGMCWSCLRTSSTHRVFNFKQSTYCYFSLPS